MPTFDVSDTFWRQYSKLSPQQLDEFYEDLNKFIHDLSRIENGALSAIRAGLRIKPYHGDAGLMELTWAGDGRAIFRYGPERLAGKRHIQWIAIGTHDIF